MAANPVISCTNLLQEEEKTCHTIGFQVTARKVIHNQKVLLQVQGVPIKSGIRKSGIFCFIYQVSNHFQQINDIPPDNLVQCSYFEYNRFYDMILWGTRITKNKLIKG